MKRKRTSYRYSRKPQRRRGYISGARRQTKRRKLWLCGSILASVFLIVLAARWLPQTAEKLERAGERKGKK